jgi:exodeoxyribonuclease V beta subunit
LADGAAPPRLRDLGRADRLTELEFHFAVNGTQPRQLDRLLSEHGYADTGLAESTLPALHGLMKGYIDLVFRHRGHYYIVDYKSNHLGNDLTNYDTPGLHRAMAQHQYRLQYLIYCVALHRWLAKRLPDYDYDRHIGGVYYLFIRGMRPDDGPTRGIVHDRPPRSLIEELDQAFHAPLNGSPSDRST